MLLLLLPSCFSGVRLLATPWTAAYQAPLSMGLSRQEYWSGVPLPSPLSTGPGVYLASPQAPSPTHSYSFTLSLRDEAAYVPVMLRASFADRTLAWVSRWGRKKLILAPFLFYPQRFFEVGQNPDPWSLWHGAQSYTPIQGSGGTSRSGGAVCGASATRREEISGADLTP